MAPGRYQVFNPEGSAAFDPIPVTAEALPPIAAAASPVRRAAPDLGALGPTRRPVVPAAASTTAPAAAPTPTVAPQASAMTAAAATPIKSMETAAARLSDTERQADSFAAINYRDRLAAASRQRAEANVIASRPAGSLAKEGGWFSEVMTSALDKYNAGAGLARTAPAPQVNILN
jgi:hypothetical protein